jgi:hypothetical protein
MHRLCQKGRSNFEGVHRKYTEKAKKTIKNTIRHKYIRSRETAYGEFKWKKIK